MGWEGGRSRGAEGQAQEGKMVLGGGKKQGFSPATVKENEKKKNFFQKNVTFCPFETFYIIEGHFNCRKNRKKQEIILFL